jgi:carbonic anhydrase/acetyltransferase-like protein (isoleucine patch superfamily)
MKNIISARGKSPQVGSDCFVAPNAFLIGDVTLGARSSIWFNVTLRGDVMPIHVGNEVNIQDGSTLHGTFNKCGVEIADRATIGHNVVLHGCKIGLETLVGMGSVIMDQADIGDHCIVGAGSLVTEGSKFPSGMLILGRPAKAVRPLTKEEKDFLPRSADNYLLYKTWYKDDLQSEEK